MTATERRRVVLVVDDDASIRRVVRTVLEADGFSVVEAADGPAALGLLDAPFDHRSAEAVILDIMMPGLDGIEVCRQLDHGKVKVLILSARDDADTRERAHRAGADAYLTKPFSAIELLEAIERLAPV
ncbi:MAG: response regulator transcription factor [Acidimicrobiia bacterium]